MLNKNVTTRIITNPEQFVEVNLEKLNYSINIILIKKRINVLCYFLYKLYSKKRTKKKQLHYIFFYFLCKLNKFLSVKIGNNNYFI